MKKADKSFGYDISKLRYEANGVVFMCPFGVLLDIIDHSKWEPAYDGTSFLWDGWEFAIPKDFQKRAKMKTSGAPAINDFMKMHTFAEVAKYVEENYQEI